MNSCEPSDWVLGWQTKLHAWAVADPHRRFPDLYNLVYDLRTLSAAWEHLKANKGSQTAGVDGMTRYHVEQRVGVTTFLRDLHTQLKTHQYRPQPVRQKGIPKTNGKVRYLGIPTLRDRLVQQAVRMVLEPVFEADFYPGSYAYRPGRRAQDAIAEIYQFVHPHAGYAWVIEGDITACFDHVDHDLLLQDVRQRVTDRHILRLLRRFLRAGLITETGVPRSTVTGTPQGGILSPLLANLYLTRLDRLFAARWAAFSRHAGRRQYLRRRGQATYRLVRYADDFVILVNGTREQAEALKAETADWIRDTLRMELSAEKTHITHIQAGFDFLGHTIRATQSRYGPPGVHTYPSQAALHRVMQKVKGLTRRQTLTWPLSLLLQQVNAVVRGWVYYFRHDVAKRAFAYLDHYVWHRVWRWLQKKHPNLPWKTIRRRYCPAWQFQEDGVTLFRAHRVPIVRYRFRGARIPHAWNTPPGETDRHRDRDIGHADAQRQDRLATLLAAPSLVESRMR